MANFTHTSQSGNSMKVWNDATRHAVGGDCYPSKTNFPAILHSLIADKQASPIGALADGTTWLDLIQSGYFLTLATSADKTALGIKAGAFTPSGTLASWPATSKLLMVVTGDPTANTQGWVLGDEPAAGAAVGVQSLRAAASTTQICKTVSVDYFSFAAFSPLVAQTTSLPECWATQFDISNNSGISSIGTSGAGVEIGRSRVNNAPTGTVAGMSSADLATQQLAPNNAALGALYTQQVSVFALATALTASELIILALWQAKYPSWICPLLKGRALAV